jgi:hypothetical protein
LLLRDRDNFEHGLMLAVAMYRVNALFSFVADRGDLVSLHVSTNDFRRYFDTAYGWRTHHSGVAIDDQERFE